MLQANARMRRETHAVPYDVQLGNGITVQCKETVIMDLQLPSCAGLVVLRGVRVDVLPGEVTPLLIGRPEMRALGYDAAEQVIGEKALHNLRARMAKRVHIVPPTTAETSRLNDLLLDDQASDDETRTTDGIAFPLVTPDMEDIRKSVQKGLTEKDAALMLLLRQARANGAPEAFLQLLKTRLETSWRDAFRTRLGHDPPAKVPPLRVQIIEGVRLPRGYQTRKYSPEHVAAINEEITGLVNVGVIHTASEGVVVISCVHMVRKPAGRGWRMTVDYRGINKCTVPEAWPFPRLDDLLQQIGPATCFGSLDLLKGYWQFPLDAEAMKYYAFRTHDGVYEWSRVPMGARNAATHFQKVMCHIFRKAGLLHRGVLVYLDDILVYANSVEELAAIWDRVFSALKEHGIFANPGKCNLYAERIVWCGHMLSAKGVEPDPKRLAALAAVPTPTTAKELMQFLAASNWIRDSIPRFSEIIAPLQTLLNSALQGKGHKASAAAGVRLATHGWSDEHVKAFAALKEAIKNQCGWQGLYRRTMFTSFQTPVMATGVRF